ncbi:MAG TPA: ferritin-like domain-containing protein, partial [Polyangiaceae bacterium]|nr:ferritin-like domain-containing protein [Polyangiaceae bacterium]
ASRPKAQAFDGVSARDLARGYAEMMGRLFLSEPSLGLRPSRIVLEMLDLREEDLIRLEGPGVASVEAAERAAEREHVVVSAL